MTPPTCPGALVRRQGRTRHQRHGRQDVLLPPAYAQQVHDQASSATKEMVWITTHNHVELYDQAPYVPQALAAIIPFPANYLAGS